MLSARSFALVVVALVSVDQLAKLWVQWNLPLSARVPLLGDGFCLVHYANRGAIGGVGGELPWMAPALALAGLLLIAVLLAGYQFYRTYLGASWRAQAFLALSIAALLCTLIDRARLGYVVDFIHVPGLAVFNLGDLLPSLAAVFLALEAVAVVKGDRR